MATEVKVFNKYSVLGIKVKDPGLSRYIGLNPRIVPKTGGKNIGTRFHKSKTFIVERLINKIMNSGHKAKKHKATSYTFTGKGLKEEMLERAVSLSEEKYCSVGTTLSGMTKITHSIKIIEG